MKLNGLIPQGKNMRIAKNIMISFSTKIVLMLLNIIVPRLFIVSYGSEVNGLLSTITQIFGYLALLEAGIGGASVNALYKPLDQQDQSQISEVLGQSRTYFRKVTLFYVLGVVAFAAIYPFVSGSEVDKLTILTVILLQGAGNCLGYYFSAPYTQLLIADGKNYLVDVISFSISVGTSITKIILVSIGCNIIWVQLGFFLVTILKIPAILLLCRKQYPWLRPIRTKKYDLLHERNAFVVHEVSSTLFFGTDIFLISTFCSFSLASVYSIYQMIFGALSTMVNTANSGLGFVLGQNYYKDQKEFIKLYDRYSALYSSIVFIVMTVAYLMITPFVALYTNDVTDINYSIRGLPLLFAIINLMSGVRAVAARLIIVTGHAAKTQYRSIVETVVNLMTSLILVNCIGIHGVLLGTILALLYRMNDIIIYANKVILQRSPWPEYKRLLTNGLVFVIIAVVAQRLPLIAGSYFELFGLAVIVMIAVTLIYSCSFLLVNRQLIKGIKKKRRGGRNEHDGNL